MGKTINSRISKELYDIIESFRKAIEEERKQNISRVEASKRLAKKIQRGEFL